MFFTKSDSAHCCSDLPRLIFLFLYEMLQNLNKYNKYSKKNNNKQKLCSVKVSVISSSGVTEEIIIEKIKTLCVPPFLCGKVSLVESRDENLETDL